VLWCGLSEYCQEDERLNVEALSGKRDLIFIEDNWQHKDSCASVLYWRIARLPWRYRCRTRTRRVCKPSCRHKLLAFCTGDCECVYHGSFRYLKYVEYDRQSNDHCIALRRRKSSWSLLWFLMICTSPSTTFDRSS